MATTTSSTTDHEEVRAWVEKRGGKPATVKGTGKKSDSTGILRIDFPGYSGEDSSEEISWDTKNLPFYEQGRFFISLTF